MKNSDGPTTRAGQPVDHGEFAQLAAENARLNAMLGRAHLGLDTIGDAVVATDNRGRIDYVNAAAERLLGFGYGEITGLPAADVFSFRSAETKAALASPLSRCLRLGRTIQRAGRSLLIARSGRGVLVNETATPLRSADGSVSGALLILRDQSRENDLSERLSWQNRHERLTGLLNREEFERQLAREILRLDEGDGSRHSLLVLDLDRFRVINNTAGHAAGDRALLQTARLIQEQIRESDVAARLGGDEFAVLLLDCNAADAVNVARKLADSVERYRFGWQGREFQVTASIGVVSIDCGMTSQGILSAADGACFSAKQAGRNTVSFCPANESPASFRDMQWVRDIGRACDEGRFRMHCQPIVPIGKNGGVPHYELLLRINEREGGVVPAQSFLPAAERFNMMPAIDRWVLKHTLERLVSRGSATPEYMLSVNLSGASLSDTAFLEFARGLLREAQLPHGALCFEITETAAISNIHSVARFMREMRTLGCQFSLDDFGSGLSSFAYLKELPVDFLKIDGRFIRNVDEDVVDHTMVSAIGHIGSAMGVKTVAERVENSATLERLATMGIDYAQGYYFSRPAPVENRAEVRRLSGHFGYRAPAATAC